MPFITSLKTKIIPIATLAIYVTISDKGFLISGTYWHRRVIYYENSTSANIENIRIENCQVNRISNLIIVRSSPSTDI